MTWLHIYDQKIKYIIQRKSAIKLHAGFALVHLRRYFLTTIVHGSCGTKKQNQRCYRWFWEITFPFVCVCLFFWTWRRQERRWRENIKKILHFVSFRHQPFLLDLVFLIAAATLRRRSTIVTTIRSANTAKHRLRCRSSTSSGTRRDAAAACASDVILKFVFLLVLWLVLRRLPLSHRLCTKDILSSSSNVSSEAPPPVPFSVRHAFSLRQHL